MNSRALSKRDADYGDYRTAGSSGTPNRDS